MIDVFKWLFAILICVLLMLYLSLLFSFLLEKFGSNICCSMVLSVKNGPFMISIRKPHYMYSTYHDMHICCITVGCGNECFPLFLMWFWLNISIVI